MRDGACQTSASRLVPQSEVSRNYDELQALAGRFIRLRRARSTWSKVRYIAPAQQGHTYRVGSKTPSSRHSAVCAFGLAVMCRRKRERYKARALFWLWCDWQPQSVERTVLYGLAGK